MDNDEEEKLRRKKNIDEYNRSRKFQKIITIGMILVFVLDMVLDTIMVGFNYGLLSFIGFNNWLWGILYEMKGND